MFILELSLFLFIFVSEISELLLYFTKIHKK